MAAELPRGNPERGKEVFMKACAHCHSILQGGRTIYGPNLFGMFDRKSGSVEGYVYSDGHKNLDLSWNKQNLNNYLEDPYKIVPGTKKHYHGLKKAQDRADVIAYMEQNK